MKLGALAAALLAAALPVAAPSPASAVPPASAPAPPPPPATPAPAPVAPAIATRILILPFDALGMSADKVDRLEALFRMELERLAGAPSPSRRALERALARAPALRGCSGEARCLAAIGKRLGVDQVVSSNVAELGDSYVVNTKVVDVRTGAELRRIASEPLRGRPDELIEAVRVAAYRLLAPGELHGALAVLVDRPGATVTLDGRAIGTTPLRGTIPRLALGPHRLTVEAPRFAAFAEDVVVRFQKTTRVVVRLAPEPTVDLGIAGARPIEVRERRAWYQSTWFIVGVGAAAIVAGGAIGRAMASDSVIDCGADPVACR